MHTSWSLPAFGFHTHHATTVAAAHAGTYTWVRTASVIAMVVLRILVFASVLLYPWETAE